ncbi:hypothetical protein PMAYCL1PPCAC_17573 [Pristionchus mayeri]|uniref:Uncharacterized protein n=1 Tax=Pristionchus mayeri TaxID=1317129 RepID=A0AAN5CMZ4_9BILA|nr:hypothetical protein PMAYCL1PPCAC_17573 [Pristionchus mayeri]
MTITKRLITATDWVSMRGEMREDVSSSGTTLLSSASPIAPSQASGRKLPTFTRPNLLAVVPPPLPPSNSSIISRPFAEQKKEGSGMKFLRPPPLARPQIPSELAVPLSSRPTEFSPSIEASTLANGTPNHAQIDRQIPKKEPKEIGQSSIGNGRASGQSSTESGTASKDEMMSYMDEKGWMTQCSRKKMSEEAVTMDKVVEVVENVEGGEKARRSEIASKSTLFSLRQRRVNEEEDEYLRTEESNMADICEVLMQESSPFNDNFIRTVKKDRAIGTLLDMMIRGALKPVQVSEWADKADYDEYYLDNYARRVCNKLTPGIVKIKTDNVISSSFIMGEALTEYAKFSKIVYYYELMAIVSVHGGIYEKDIPSTLGMNSLLSHFPIDHSSPFIVLQKPEGRYITMRV